MKKYQLHTSIKCAACVAKVTEKFKEDNRIQNFSVDLKDPKKTLTVEVDDELSERKIKEYLKEIGYYALTPEKSIWQKIIGK